MTPPRLPSSYLYLFSLFFLFPSILRSAPPDAPSLPQENGIPFLIPERVYVEQLILKADQIKLHKRRYWLLLLHYLPGTAKEKQGSEADGQGFFFSDKGGKDPRSELHASLRAFFEDPQAYAKNTHPQCKFPARFRWLREKLAFDPQKTPQLKCPALDFWLSVISYDSLSIVFASYYLNAPASSFGHTFLKINSQRFKGHDLLSYAVDYAARVPEDIDFMRYALYGLWGGFRGHFSVLPYHIKVKSYNDIEERDLWEYQLDLKKEELYRMLLHVYELEQTYFDYYFAGENCSYHILSLLEIARPELDLRSHYKWVTFPAETIKLLFKSNALSRTSYRPSVKETTNQRIRKLTLRESKIFYLLLRDRKRLSETDFGRLEKQRKLFLLDSLLASLRSKIEYAEKNEQNEKEKRYYEYLLKERVKLPPSAEDFQVEQDKIAPHLSHAPFGLSFLGGISSYGTFAGLRLRPLLHELLNVDDGYPRDSDLIFLGADLRWYERETNPKLYNLEVLKLRSLVPYEPYNKSISYAYSLRIDSEFFKSRNRQAQKIKKGMEHRNVGEAEGFMGYSFSISKSSRNICSLLGGALYRHAPSRWENKNTIAPAFSALFLYGSDRWRGQIWFAYYPFSLFFEEQNETRLKLALRYAFSKNMESYLELEQRKNYQAAALRLLIQI